MARLSLHIPSIFKKPAQESDGIEQPHAKTALYGMSMLLLSMVCFIFILWVIMTLVRLFSGLAV